MINVESVRAGYGDGPDILNGISLTANPARIVTILGPNGCGKSTLLKCIAGFVRPRSGIVRMSGEDVTHIRTSEKVCNHRVGFVPQTDNVFSTMSVRENIALGGRLMRKIDSERRFDELMAQYPSLAAKLNRRASALSGGERQLLSLARALISEPSILLLDEPSAGLSPRMMHEVFEAISIIRDRDGICILMVEQNAFEALHVSDTAYILSLGTVAMHGKAADLLADPDMRSLYLGGEATH
ncbi:ABC transporter ATP-binding protein [Pseudomonas chlororaphis]|uniref:Branched-chain amino acid ABC transporter ATPase n=1 Tax=Pseudomonas frederiksbergensis TaxID=104087 RepID=A0A0B1YWI9_9PSED|nr:ABC transporter ATP-binding protein [Pseudomonas chlororaphis]KHK61552.1 branched-chain amino acid ABC transporter ATPase [Pseudomonas frederiksbergensis]